MRGFVFKRAGHIFELLIPLLKTLSYVCMLYDEKGDYWTGLKHGQVETVMLLCFSSVTLVLCHISTYLLIRKVKN